MGAYDNSPASMRASLAALCDSEWASGWEICLDVGATGVKELKWIGYEAQGRSQGQYHFLDTKGLPHGPHRMDLFKSSWVKGNWASLQSPLGHFNCVGPCCCSVLSLMAVPWICSRFTLSCGIVAAAALFNEPCPVKLVALSWRVPFFWACSCPFVCFLAAVKVTRLRRLAAWRWTRGMNLTVTFYSHIHTWPFNPTEP